MTLEPSGLGPSGDVALLAAMLRADRADVESYARVLAKSTLADALPGGHGRGRAAPRTRQIGWRVATGARSPSSWHGVAVELELREGPRGGRAPRCGKSCTVW